MTGDGSRREDRVDALERRIDDLEDQLLSLVASVRFDTARPYSALLLGLQLVGEQRVAVGLVLHAVLARAEGRDPGSLRDAEVGGFDISEAFVDAPLDRDGAVGLVARVLRLAPVVAERILDAHEQQGLGADGHAALRRLPQAQDERLAPVEQEYPVVPE